MYWKIMLLLIIVLDREERRIEEENHLIKQPLGHDIVIRNLLHLEYIMHFH